MDVKHEKDRWEQRTSVSTWVPTLLCLANLAGPEIKPNGHNFKDSAIKGKRNWGCSDDFLCFTSNIIDIRKSAIYCLFYSSFNLCFYFILAKIAGGWGGLVLPPPLQFYWPYTHTAPLHTTIIMTGKQKMNKCSYWIRPHTHTFLL